MDEALPRLRDALLRRGAAVLTAPPGAGKTTRIPPALLDLAPGGGRIVMLEPRRLAAVAAARWMARGLGEEVGGTVGYAIRFERRVSASTRIEVVTEGILTRRLQTDPSLAGVAMVIFDEFHERSLNSDLALALCLDARRGLREDLSVLVMSATLDVASVAALLGDAPVITSEGRAFPVEVRYLGDDRGARLPDRVAGAVVRVLGETEGDILVFLPGAGEIRACQGLLEEATAVRAAQVTVHPLFADLPFEAQERAILPGPRRKVVLATSIAETSLTIEGVRVVVDSGLARRVEHHPASGMDRLVTVPVSRAEAAQRAGRAGRTSPGVCVRLYSRHAFEGMAAFALPEIQRADLASLALELALWGARDPGTLPWLDPPPASRLAAARELLALLGAIDPRGAPTEAARAMARLPLHPRLARLVVRAAETGSGRAGCEIAAVLAGRDVLVRSVNRRASHAGACDLEDRVEALRRYRRTGRPEAGTEPAALQAAARTVEQLERLLQGNSRRRDRVGTTDLLDAPMGILLGRLLLDAFPDRLARLRAGEAERYLLASGRGARLSPASCVRGHELIVAVEVDAGAHGEGIIHAATAVDAAAVREECAGRLVVERTVSWDDRARRVVGVERERLGAVALSERPFTPGDGEAIPVLCDALRRQPSALLPFGNDARQLQARVRLLASHFAGEGWPDLSDAALFASPETWLAPFLGGVRGARDLARVDVVAALRSLVPPRLLPRLEQLAPTHLTVPSGRRVALDYEPAEGPVLAVKLQELFGLGETPAVAGGRAPVVMHLLSPAGRPVQVTRDLRGFWDGAYRQVRAELRGRYPKHPWPDDPWNAPPTAKAKLRTR